MADAPFTKSHTILATSSALRVPLFLATPFSAPLPPVPLVAGAAAAPSCSISSAVTSPDDRTMAPVSRERMSVLWTPGRWERRARSASVSAEGEGCCILPNVFTMDECNACHNDQSEGGANVVVERWVELKQSELGVRDLRQFSTPSLNVEDFGPVPVVLIMGSSAKKKREKKSDFQKTKLKVGKARPQNTNATSTSFTAKSIILKQQSLSETARDGPALFNHNLSLVSSSNAKQRENALQYLTTVCLAAGEEGLPQSASAIVAKAQPYLIDGSKDVRNQVLRLFKALPASEIGPLDTILLYTKAGMVHLADDIKLFSLDVLDWLLQSNAEAVMACPGGWAKTLRTFQNLLSWHGGQMANGAVQTNGGWSATKTASNKLGSNKLLVHQLNTLANFLSVGLMRPPKDPQAAAKLAAAYFPLYQYDRHMLSRKSNPFGYLNLFGAPRDAESEIYEDTEERVSVLNELGLAERFQEGAREAKKEAGEVGRAASAVVKALRLAEVG
ncbi:rRNA processing protein [Teratosphaeriaceae sp. CCFEE 6253]|nr:rRNA processing protein [Teratosphaeriaceae sp. CCFEE 6253]